MRVETNSVVKFEYELWVDGSKVEGTEAQCPKTILMGHAPELPKGLEAALLGLEVGQYRLVVPPEQGYGPYDPALRVEVAIADLPEAPRVGGGFSGTGPSGEPMLYRVIAIQGEQAVLDANPPLAGKTLEYRVNLQQVRRAEPEELEHGHIHGEGGIHH